jgi:hypothetical protein
VDQNAFLTLKGSSILNRAIQDAQVNQQVTLQDRLASVLGKQKQYEAEGTIKGTLNAYGLGSPATSAAPAVVGQNADGTPIVAQSAQPTTTGAPKGVELLPDSPQYKLRVNNREGLDNLRKQYEGLQPIKDFQQVSTAADALAGALKDKHSVTDQELVRYSIQMIEPGMAVREGEQNAVAGSQSIPDAWKGQLNKALAGGTALDDDVREGIRNLAMRAYSAKAAQYTKATDYYNNLALSRGLLGNNESISYLGAPASAESVFSKSSNLGIGDLSLSDVQAAAKAEQARRLKGVENYFDFSKR